MRKHEYARGRVTPQVLDDSITIDDWSILTPGKIFSIQLRDKILNFGRVLEVSKRRELFALFCENKLIELDANHHVYYRDRYYGSVQCRYRDMVGVESIYRVIVPFIMSNSDSETLTYWCPGSYLLLSKDENEFYFWLSMDTDFDDEVDWIKND